MLSAMVAALESTERVVVSDNSVLTITLDRPLADRDFEDPFSSISFGGGDLNRMGVDDVRAALNHAMTDPKIEGVVLFASSLPGGMALGQELRKAISEFKNSGKFVVAYGDRMTEGGYYISSVADELYISPEGSLEWNGLNVEMSFFKNTFEKLDIEPQIFRVGDFKSAIEPFILEKMSDENRYQVRSYMNSIYNRMVVEVAEDVELSAEELREISDKYTVRTITQAVENGLITDARYFDEFLEIVAAKLGGIDPDEINKVEYDDYNTTYSRYSASRNRIAVIEATGAIMMGKSERGIIGAKTLTREIRKARNNDRIKAIVLRIESPGGDALASDLIWREVIKTKEVKPVIASFGNVAASGGYYIGMGADTIVAQPNTITGSIGIFSVIFNIGDFMANKLGITSDFESTGQYSGMYTALRSLTEEEKAIIQQGVEEGYETFTGKAASGRNMSKEELKKLASGRVWSGSQAKENGLVDILGGLDTSIEIAAIAAGIEDEYTVRFYPEQKTTLEQIMAELSGQARMEYARYKLGDMYPYYEVVKKMEALDGIQARLPFDLVIK